MLTNFFILFINYILIILAHDDFYKTELKHRNTNKIDTEQFDMTSVSLLGRQQFEENSDHKQTHSQLDKKSVNNHITTVSDKFNENDQPGETRANRTKQAANAVKKLIVVGKKVNIDAYPWMVHLIIFLEGKPETECGANLISSKYVVTAAHCLPIWVQDLNDIHLILGEYDTRTYPRDCVYSNFAQKCVNNVEMFPEQVIRHESYSYEPKLSNDIALIRLRGFAPSSESIRPIPLPTFDIDNPRNRGRPLTVAGWGRLNEEGPTSSVKLETRVNLVPFDECRELTWLSGEGKVCAMGQRGQDSCYGDSGGPLMAYSQGNYFLVGIVSGKELYAKCGSKVPTIYTNVYQYLEWIKRNMRA